MDFLQGLRGFPGGRLIDIKYPQLSSPLREPTLATVRCWFENIVKTQRVEHRQFLLEAIYATQDLLSCISKKCTAPYGHFILTPLT